MDQSNFEDIKAEVDAGLDELEIRRKIETLNLNPESRIELSSFLADEIALRELIKVKSTDANLIIYLGYFFMILAIIFLSFIGNYAWLIFGLGFVIMRRGRRRLKEAKSISSIEELLPYRPTKFHR